MSLSAISSLGVGCAAPDGAVFMSGLAMGILVFVPVDTSRMAEEKDRLEKKLAQLGAEPAKI